MVVLYMLVLAVLIGVVCIDCVVQLLEVTAKWY